MMMTVIRDVAAFRPSIRQYEREEQVQKMENKEKETDRGGERLTKKPFFIPVVKVSQVMLA